MLWGPKPVEASPTLEDVYGVLQAAKETETPWWSLHDILVKLPPPLTLARVATTVTGIGLNNQNPSPWLAIAGVIGLGAVFSNDKAVTWEIEALKKRSEQVQSHLDRLVKEGRIKKDKIAKFGVTAYRVL